MLPIAPSAPAAPAPRASKRKRAQMSYLQDDDFDQLDIEPPEHVQNTESSDDEADGRKRSIKKNPVEMTAKKEPDLPKKTKPFRFMDLTAELRNEIYEVALTEPDGLTLVAKRAGHRRSIQRGPISVSEDKNYYGKARRRASYFVRPQDGVRSEQYTNLRSLVPNLLASSKQIRDEGSSYLYKQDFILADTKALHLFVATIGSHNRQLLARLTIRGWTEGGHNFGAFTMLQFCPNLQCLFFDCTLSRYRLPKELARQIYCDSHLFLDAICVAQGSPDAAIKILRLGDWHFNKKRSVFDFEVADGDPEFDQSQRNEFDRELRKLLTTGVRR